jgi:crotonobetainyl-CoA:carnitine CoA-transferase CaiB-like acyl-CoA transferase
VSTAGPLAGLKVLDLSRFIAGPLCGMLLGDLGAEVVKVERPRSGDEARALGPRLGGESLYVMVFNRNKRSLTLNFRDPRAQRLLRELTRQADILIENFRPGVMESMGCSWDALREVNPRLIMARVSGFGQDGPLASEPCFDVIGQAMSGLMEITGQADGPPTMAGTYVVDYSAAFYATIGVLAALEHRHATARGQLVDVSLLDSAVSLLVTAIPEQLHLGRAPTRDGNRDRYAAPAQTFRAGDGVWVHVVGGNEAHFPRLARAMKREDLLSDPDFATLGARCRNVDRIERVVADWIARMTGDEAVAALKRAEVPAARVATLADVVANPQLRHREQIVEVEHPSAGRIAMPGLTMKLSESPASVRRSPPRLGEHTDEVLREWLAVSPDHVAQLRADGIV